MTKEAHLLLAHGSRDPEWRLPFEILAADLKAIHPERPIRLCYLELWHPMLTDAIQEEYGRGIRTFRISPLFWSRGRHLREDLPRLVDAVMIPGMHIRIDGPLGLNEEVLRAALTALT